MRAVVAGLRTQYLLVALTPLVFIDVLMQPLVYGLLVGARSGRPDAVLLLGIALFGLWGAIITQAALGVVMEKQWRTLELTLASPTPIGLPMAGKVLAAMLNGVAAAPAGWLLISALWGPPAGLSFAEFILLFVVGAASLLAYGLLLMGMLARHRFFAGMLNGLYDTVAVLAALFVPAALLPGFLGDFSLILGPRWAMEAARDMSAGAAWGTEVLIGAGLAVLALIVGGVYLATFERALRRDPEMMLL